MLFGLMMALLHVSELLLLGKTVEGNSYVLRGTMPKFSEGTENRSAKLRESLWGSSRNKAVLTTRSRCAVIVTTSPLRPACT